MKPLLFLCLCSALTSCGFHLRGSTVLPRELQHIALQTPTASGQFTQRLMLALQGAGAHVVDKPQKTNLTLLIEKEQAEKIFHSVNSNVQLHNYTLRYNIDYQLLNRKQQALMKPQHIVVTRSYNENANQILGSSHEEALLVSEMKSEAMQKLLERLASDDTVISLQKNRRHEIKR